MRAALLAAILLAAAAPRVTPAQSDAEAAPPEVAVAAPAEAGPVAPPGPPAVAPAGAEAKRSGAYLGFSFGTGRGDVFAGGTTTSIDDLVPGVSPTTLALMLRFGWASGNLLFGFQMNLVRSQWEVSGATSAMQIAGLDVVTTLRDSQLGLYARVGVGPAQLTFDANGTSSQTWNGTEAMLGVGLSHGGFGVGIDYVRQSYDSSAPIDGAGYLLATLSLDLG